MTSDNSVKQRKKLIEVAIPLEAINAASAKEKNIRHGHPSTLHLWWARRPLAAARAVIFCQMVDDPSSVPEEFPTAKEQEAERLRLFSFIEELVQWENTSNEEVIERAIKEINRSWHRCCSDNANHPQASELFNPSKLPAFHDPFAGGGALPLEAQRLGLDSYASDLNPVAVLINKAMIEIPPRFSGLSPVNSDAQKNNLLFSRKWKGSESLAEDVRYYGQWMCDQAKNRIGHLYPKVFISTEIAYKRNDLKQFQGKELNVIAWLWARTVKSPNPAFAHIHVPLVSNFMISSKVGNEAYVEPIIEKDNYSFVVKKGKPENLESIKSGTKYGRGNFRCLLSGIPIKPDYIKSEAQAGRMGIRMMAIVAEGKRGRVFINPLPEHEEIALKGNPDWKPDIDFYQQALGFRVGNYGMSKWSDLYTNRQLIALSTYSELISDVCHQVKLDALKRSFSDNEIPLRDGGDGALAYSEAIGIYLALGVSRLADAQNSLCQWGPSMNQTQHLFRRQAISMLWDFSESNIFGNAAGDLNTTLSTMCRVIKELKSSGFGSAQQFPAQSQNLTKDKIVSTDPPYYDNIGYSDLSDFFYVWLRKSVEPIFPLLFSTLISPKSEEIVATPARHGGRSSAEIFFLQEMTKAMKSISTQASMVFPISIYYAFKQSEKKDSPEKISTGWETFLDAVLSSGMLISGTWPIRTEREARSRGLSSNALASSMILICQRRPANASIISRNEFRRDLRRCLLNTIKNLKYANIAPVDVAQAAIGPGMTIYSQVKAVLKPDDSRMSVREALMEINVALEELLSQDEGTFDSNTRFAITFFESHGYNERPYGEAEGLAVARNISVDGVVRAGIIKAISGKVKLLRREELDNNWEPSNDQPLCIWEATQNLIKRLELGGEISAGSLLHQIKRVSGGTSLTESCRALVYRLYNHCEKNNQAEEARSYNGLIVAWPELEHLSKDEELNDAIQTTIV